MSQHPSLRSKSKDKAHRSVYKRHERLKELEEKEKWDEEQSVFGLPKLKIVKFKIKKEKAPEAAAVEGEAAEGAVAGAEGKAPVAGEKGKKEAAKPEAKGKEDKKKK